MKGERTTAYAPANASTPSTSRSACGGRLRTWPSSGVVGIGHGQLVGDGRPDHGGDLVPPVVACAGPDGGRELRLRGEPEGRQALGVLGGHPVRGGELA